MKSIKFYALLITLATATSQTGFAGLGGDSNLELHGPELAPMPVTPPVPVAPMPAPVAPMANFINNNFSTLIITGLAQAMIAVTYFVQPPGSLPSTEDLLHDEKALEKIIKSCPPYEHAASCKKARDVLLYLAYKVSINQLIEQAEKVINLTQVRDALQIPRMELLANLVKKDRCLMEAKRSAFRSSAQARKSSELQIAILNLYQALAERGEALLEAEKEAVFNTHPNAMIETVAPTLRLFSALVERGHATELAKASLERSRQRRMEFYEKYINSDKDEPAVKFPGTILWEIDWAFGYLERALKMPGWKRSRILGR